MIDKLLVTMIYENDIKIAYKMILRLPEFSSNKIEWLISGQMSSLRYISKISDKLILKAYQLQNTKLINKIKRLHRMISGKDTPSRNIPFILRWKQTERSLPHLYK